MDKRTTLAFVLIGLLLIVWFYINSPTPPPPMEKDLDTSLVESDSLRPSLEEEIEKAVKKEEPAAAFVDSAEQKDEQIITIETDLVKLELTSRGASIRKYYLKEFRTWYFRRLPDTANFYDRHVQLINKGSDGKFGEFNMIFVTKEGKLVNTSNLYFDSDADDYYYQVTGDDSLKISYSYQVADGSTIQKDYVFYGNDYASDVDVILENMDNVISSLRYDMVWEDGINFVENNSVDEANQANASAYSGGEQVEIDASDVGEEVSKEINGRVDWVSVRNKYFIALIAQENPSSEGGALMEGVKNIHPEWGDREIYSVSLKVPFEDRDYQKNRFKLYIGPIDYDLLKSYDEDFEAAYDFGGYMGLQIIIRPISEYILLPLLIFLHNFIPNYGFVIIVFSIIIKIALYPLTKQSYKSMKKMQQLQPKIAAMKEQYKDDPQRVQKETMKLYSTYGVNPAGGCLPMLLQMPILIALWSLFNVAIQLRNEPFIWWIHNLATPDVLFELPFKLPFVGIDQVSGLAVLLGVTMFFQQKMSIKDPSQKALVYIMPVFFTLLFMNFPAGLNLYYFMFNLLSIGQQYYINHKKGEAELVPVKNPKKKSGGFMQRMMEAAEKQAEAQKKGAKKRR